MRTLIVIVIILLSLHSDAMAQTANTAAVSGTVNDAQGAVVPGATVRLVNTKTQQERTATTNEEGVYSFPAIEPGIYDVNVTATGFGPVAVTGIKVEVTKSATVDIKLDVGNVNETVRIVPEFGQIELQKSDATVGNVIDRDRIIRLPNPNISVTSLLALQPGSTPSGEISGARGDQNTFSLDGIDVSDNAFGAALTAVIPTPSESIEEFRVSVASPNATFGRSSGGQVVLVTKRGTNQFHGSAYEYHQNGVLNANSWTNNRLGLPKPGLIDNRFGFSLGGPIFKNKTFFFFNYEGRRFPNSSQTTRLVPTDTLKQGLLRFRDASNANVVHTINPKDFDPRGLGASPAVLDLLKLYPTGNNSAVGDGLNTVGFTLNVPTNTRYNYLVFRLDHKFNDSWSLDARFSYDDTIQGDKDQVDLINRRAGISSQSFPRNASIGVIGSLRPNLILESRFGWVEDRAIRQTIRPSGLVNGFNIAGDLATDLLDEPIDVGQSSAGQKDTYNTYQFIENLTWVKNNHTVIGGANLRYITAFRANENKIFGTTSPVAQIGASDFVSIPPEQRPSFITVSDIKTYNQLYGSLLGIVDSVTVLGVRDGDLKPLAVGTPYQVEGSLSDFEFYGQDTWRVSPTLTFNYGLQYQFQVPPVERDRRFTIPVFPDSGAFINPVDYLNKKRAAAESGQVFNPDIGYATLRSLNRDSTVETDKTNFSPRIAVAWNPRFKKGMLGRLFGDQQTVIRGGYSLLYDRSNIVQTFVIPLFGVGFAQTFGVNGPTNNAGQPYRVGVDGPIPIPIVTAATSPVVPDKPFGDVLSANVDPNLKVPRNHTITFSVQRQLSPSLIFEVGYSGRMGRRLYQNVDLNSSPYFFKDPQSGQTFAQAFDALAAQIRAGILPENVTPQPWFENVLAGIGGTQTLAAAQKGNIFDGDVSSLFQFFIDFVAPQPFNNQESVSTFFRIAQGRSNYHSLFITLRKRSSRGLTFDINYTYSKSLDQFGVIQQDAFALSTAFFPDVDYGRSSFDFRHVFNANGVYDLPFGKGKAISTNSGVLNKLIGGYYLAGIFQASSGAPLSVVQGQGVFGGSPVLSLSVAAIPTTQVSTEGVNSGVIGSNRIGTAGDPSTGGTGLNIFANPEAVFKSFRPIRLTEDGRTGRGALNGFASWTFNASIGKYTNITEKVRFGLRFDIFNVFNHAIFADPELDLRKSTTFGVITSQANSPRAIQIGARFEF